MAKPYDWVQWVNETEAPEFLETVRKSVWTGLPFGDPRWAERIAKTLGIEEKLGKPGRPKTDL